MAATTTVLGLLKPAYSDDSDIGDINGNMDLIDAEAAKVRANVAASYNSSETYAVGDYCIHDGNLYKCTAAISSPEAWTAGHWTQIKIAGELTALNVKIKNLNIINLSSSTSIASLCASCPNGEHRYYGATVSTTFSDFPSEYGTLYHPIVHIIKRANGNEIIINAVSGTNTPIQINGWFENNALKWEKLALDSNLTPTTCVNLGPTGHENSIRGIKLGRLRFVMFNGAYYGWTPGTDFEPLRSSAVPANTEVMRNVVIAGQGAERYPAHVEGDQKQVFIHKNGGETALPTDGSYNVYGMVVYISRY